MDREHTLFLFDSRVIRGYRNLDVVLGEAEKHREALFKWKEKPVYRNYPNVFCDPEGKLRCYYTVVLETGEEDKGRGICKSRWDKESAWPVRHITALAYAESRDGIRWEGPDLGLVDYRGNCRNNLLRLYAHGSCVFYDANEKCRERSYKLLTRDDRESGRMCVAFSEDGIHFGEYIYPEFNQRFIGDTHNFAFYDTKEKKYIMTTRTFNGCLRIVSCCESEDFITWSDYRNIFRGDYFDDQAYSMPLFYYGGLYFGLPSIFHEGDKDDLLNDKVECELICGADTESFSRIAPHKAFIPLGEGQESDSGCIYLSAPVERDDEFWFYYTGARGWHIGFSDANLHLARIKKSRLAGLKCKNADREGRLITRPLTVKETYLILSAKVENTGYIKIRLMDDMENEIPGYDFDSFDNIQGDGEYRISWNNKGIPETEKKYILEFILYKADIYQLSGIICCVGHTKRG